MRKKGVVEEMRGGIVLKLKTNSIFSPLLENVLDTSKIFRFPILMLMSVQDDV